MLAISLLIAAIGAASVASSAAPAQATAAKAPPPFLATWDSLDKRPIPAWYRDAKFGIFIHWGVYAVPAWAPKGTYAEWYWNSMQNHAGDTWKFHQANYGADFPYEKFAPMFKAELFNPAEWADIFARSGAKYVVLTSKHHEGFALWPSADASRDWGHPWNSSEVGPHRDLLGDLSLAVRAKNLKMGIYYSLYEWYNPLYKSDFAAFRDKHFFPQFKDVVTRYKPSVIFADGEWEHTAADWHTPELLAWLYNLPASGDDLVVDDRWGSDTRGKHGGYYTTEYGGGTDFRAGPQHYWEESRGMGASYGYNRNESIDDYHSTADLIQVLASMVTKGGNLLLDIGPTADGRIPVVMQDRLIGMGKWLKANGEAIYGTTAGPYGAHEPEWGVVTAKPNKLYVHLFSRPGATVELRGLKCDITTASFLTDPNHTPLQVKHIKNPGGRPIVSIALPPILPDPMDSVIVLDITGDPAADLTITQDSSNTVTLAAGDAEVHGDSPKLETRGGLQNIGFWKNPADSLSWTFAVTKPGLFDVNITYSCENGAGGSTYTVNIGESQIVGQTHDTGGWDQFTKLTVGQVLLSKPGKYTLTIQPSAAPPWKMMNVRSVTLTPGF